MTFLLNYSLDGQPSRRFSAYHTYVTNTSLIFLNCLYFSKYAGLRHGEGPTQRTPPTCKLVISSTRVIAFASEITGYYS